MDGDIDIDICYYLLYCQVKVHEVFYVLICWCAHNLINVPAELIKRLDVRVKKINKHPGALFCYLRYLFHIYAEVDV